MRKIKLVDSLNSKKMIGFVDACNWYIDGFYKKCKLDKHWKREHNQIGEITIIIDIKNG